MAKIRITKEFAFEMGHALWNYDGKCKHIHGHSYKLFVTIIGEPINNPNEIKNGMVLDFGILKKIVKDEIIDVCDHAIMLNKLAPTQDLIKYHPMFDKIIIRDYQPTCENMLIDFSDRIKARLPEFVKLHSLKLHETSNSYAEWYAIDNELIEF